MPDRSDARAVLVTGAYGAGKTSLIEEAAEVLEERHVRYAAIDLDWLCWFDPGSPDHAAAVPTLLKNIDAVVGNYYDAGVRLFALARTMETQREVDAVGAAMAMPMTTVRLTAPLDEIERRLTGSITAGRGEDLRMAREWFAHGGHEEIGDLVIANDRPIRAVAVEMLAALGWA
jgi:chloramphenicol 3-O-phosphotransferase